MFFWRVLAKEGCKACICRKPAILGKGVSRGINPEKKNLETLEKIFMESLEKGDEKLPEKSMNIFMTN